MMVNKTTERALLARPLVFVLGAAASAFVNPSLRTGPLLLWVAGIFGGINLALWMLRDRRFFSRLSVLGSPVVALLGWAIVATFTGGLESPFVAAFFFEIILAGVSMGPRGVLWVTANSIVILALIQILPYGFKDGWQLLVLEGMFVAAIGGLGAAMARRRRVGERALRTQSENLGQRLESLQRELEDERVISRVGENVARLAHGLKNAVHSLRGFVGLIEPHLERGAGTNAAMAGLRAAIDDLEKLARLTLAENGPASAAQTAAGATSGAVATAPDRVSRVAAVVEEAHREISNASPNVHWTIVADAAASGLRVPIGETSLLELLIILMRNGVEAMEGTGNGSIEIVRQGDRCLLMVSDEGEGFAPGVLANDLQPGFTTKEKGSGFGLFLARRIVEDHGGSLRLERGDLGGARVAVDLPLSKGGEVPRSGGSASSGAGLR